MTDALYEPGGRYMTDALYAPDDRCTTDAPYAPDGRYTTAGPHEHGRCKTGARSRLVARSRPVGRSVRDGHRTRDALDARYSTRRVRRTDARYGRLKQGGRYVQDGRHRRAARCGRHRPGAGCAQTGHHTPDAPCAAGRQAFREGSSRGADRSRPGDLRLHLDHGMACDRWLRRLWRARRDRSWSSASWGRRPRWGGTRGQICCRFCGRRESN